MENNILTAEEFLLENYGDNYNILFESYMIEFAKLHVQAALEIASKNVNTKGYYGDRHKDAKEGKITVTSIDDDGYVWIIDRESITNAYPIELIK